MVSNKQVLFTKVPTTYPAVGEHMQVKESDIDLDAKLPEGDFILKTLVLSVDPYMRGRMRNPDTKSYSEPFTLGQPMNGHIMSVVVKSNNPDFKVNDLVYGTGQFVEYMHVPKAYAGYFEVRNEARTSNLPITNYVGALGMPGMTAYVGLKEIGKPKKGETLYVSAASGAVGQLVGQLGKELFGLRVVGSAGSDDKVAYLKEIGFDGAFNYKTEAIDDKLAELCPKGIDIYFENVGGKMLEAVIRHANNFARIVACGMISQYNLAQPEPVHNLMSIVAKRLTIEGFIVTDDRHKKLIGEFRKEVTRLLQDKKIQYRETVANGIENTPGALVDVLKGHNFGKQVVKVSDL